MHPFKGLLFFLVTSLSAAEIQRDVAYVPGGSAAQRLDFYPAAVSGGKTPLVVWIHGGAWLGGDKRQNPAEFLTRSGYAVASINYRLSSESIFPAQIQDCKAAIRFLRANAGQFGINPERIGVWGGSAGGHLVALLGTSGDVTELEGSLGSINVSSRVQAVVNYFGPADLLTMGAQSGPGGKLNHDSPDSPESKLIGGAVQENKDKARAASPVSYVSKDDPPMLHVHGDKDPLVPVGQSQQLHAALEKAGVSSALRVVAGGGHGNGFPTRVLNEEVQAFLDLYLK